MGNFDNAGECLYGLVVDRKEVDWEDKIPHLSGYFNGGHWDAVLLNGSWHVIPKNKYLFDVTIREAIENYINEQTLSE